MFSRRLKNGYFFIEGLNSLATVFFFYYFYYFMQKQFGFDNRANLALAALNGATYAVCSFFAGKFAQRFGYFRALKVGLFLMALAMVLGLTASSAVAFVLIMVLAVFGMSFTWPTLEALVSSGENRSGVQHMVGVYNIVWAATAAVGNFVGGAVLATLGPRSLFYVPLTIQLVELACTFWLESQARPNESSAGLEGSPVPLLDDTHPHPPSNAPTFLKMAWLANPFAYIGINTLIAVMPGVSLRLGLSTALAGFCGSIWCFARGGAFAALWAWPGWHYRFRWLLSAYLALIAGFLTVLIAPNVAVLITGQLFFGVACGLLYSSSLFYSMDASEDKGEHGGFHEAVIGVGNFAGPALGAATLQLFPPPQYAHSGAYAVTALLFAGLAGLLALWKTGNPAPASIEAESP